jgi:hypothetical protein
MSIGGVSSEPTIGVLVLVVGDAESLEACDDAGSQ